MQRAGNEFLASASFSRDEYRGIGRCNFGNLIKNGLQCYRGTDDFLKHRSPVNFIPQRQVFSVELVLQVSDLLEGLFQGRSVFILLGDIHGCADELDNFPVLADDRMGSDVKALPGSIGKNNPKFGFEVRLLVKCFFELAI